MTRPRSALRAMRAVECQPSARKSFRTLTVRVLKQPTKRRAVVFALLNAAQRLEQAV